MSREGPLKNVDGVINKPPWFYCTMCYDVQGRPSQSLGWGLCAVVLGFWKDGRGLCVNGRASTPGTCLL